MKIRVADYIANKILSYGIKQSFCVVGGGAMHLNDAFGHKKGITTLYCHHEQACAIAAEGYARINNEAALCLVTSGPGGTNAITGVAGAWTDSIPMLIISGQVRYDNTKYYNGKNCRVVGDQEIDIISIVKPITKFSHIFTNTFDVGSLIDKAIFYMYTGRLGPVWLDIPVDIQGSIIEIDEKKEADVEKHIKDSFKKYSKNELENLYKKYNTKNLLLLNLLLNKKLNDEYFNNSLLTTKELQEAASTIITKIQNAKQPVLYAGNGIRCANAHKMFLTLVQKLNIPVVVSWNGNDLIENNNKLFVGHPGGRGDRPGNLAVENADLIFSLGCRLSIRQVGYNPKNFAKHAYKIMCDVDQAELDKKTLNIDLKIHANAYDLIQTMLDILNKKHINKLFTGGEGITIKTNSTNKKLNWLETCKYYKNNYKTVLNEYYNNKNKKVNPYAFIDLLSSKLEQGSITVVGNGTPCVVGGQMYNIQKDSRFISNSGMAAMGYDLPASIGASFATDKKVILLTGDGSMQMNLQELQTIKHHQLNIKIFYLNNGGYLSIKQTQKSFFSNNCYIGIGYNSGVNNTSDISFPDIKKIAYAYGIHYLVIKNNKQMEEKINLALSAEGPMIVEVIVDENQEFLPKNTSKKMPDGSLVASTLDDMYPFLSEDEMHMLTIQRK